MVSGGGGEGCNGHGSGVIGGEGGSSEREWGPWGSPGGGDGGEGGAYPSHALLFSCFGFPCFAHQTRPPPNAPIQHPPSFPHLIPQVQ